VLSPAAADALLRIQAATGIPGLAFLQVVPGGGGVLLFDNARFKFKGADGVARLPVDMGAIDVLGLANINGHTDISSANGGNTDYQNTQLTVHSADARAGIGFQVTGAPAGGAELIYTAGRMKFMNALGTVLHPAQALAPPEGDDSDDLVTAKWSRRHGRMKVDVDAPTRDWTGIPQTGFGIYGATINARYFECMWRPGNTTYSAGAIYTNRTLYISITNAGFFGWSALTVDNTNEVPATIEAVYWG
jgi:hypothetical protein